MILAATGPEIAFWGFAVVAGIAGFFVVGSRNVVHAALYLVGVLGSVGAIYIVLGAEFVGWVQILIYVGAIVVLLLFGIMLTKAPIGGVALDNNQRPVAFIVAATTFGGLTWIIWRTFGGTRIRLSPTRTAQIGNSLFTHFVLPFEAVSVLLLAALVGAIVLARRD
ncbi:MAG: NADH-quinone oxidoreductase subunit J [Actinomycetota bacterium]|nr:NADH-quinone oxidoreductase subunit J [Actinomycetota bacterium]